MPECFVIMGFGTKPDPDTGRRLNLDSTFEFIIKPAVEAAGFTCVRADEILHSGVIDRPMYEKLLNADLVIADISTANANAIYELGVRHALRPQATIVIKEVDGQRYFDLNHLATISYKHLGEEIGAGEAKRKSEELRKLIEAKVKEPRDDSPVYEYLRGLQPPAMATLGGRRGVVVEPPAAPSGKSVAELRALADAALAQGDFAEAQTHLQAMQDAGFEDPSILQKLALATYKSAKPNADAALAQAQEIIEKLRPETSTDPETLGIAGAIRKRQWQRAKDRAALDDAIAFYGRGWSVREDYYTGENYATCLEMRADVESDQEQAMLDRMSALRVRNRLIEDLQPLVEKSATKKRDDYKWMLATLANTLLVVGEKAKAAEYEKRFLALNPLDWERETFGGAKEEMLSQAKKYAALRKRLGLKG